MDCRTRDYDAGNELTTETTGAATTYYQYDRCGNTTVQQAPAGTTYYHWDHENLLKQLDLPGGVHNYFSYDADSKRVTKQDSAGFTRFLYQGPDMLKLLQERDTNGGLIAHYTMGNGLEAMRRSSVSRFYHFDWLGSTFELTDASGVVTDSYLYNAWGEVLSRTGTTRNPHGYVGRKRYYRMPLTRFYQLGLRYFDPLIRIFLSRDPAQGLRGSYALGQGSPTASVDPTGLWPSLIGSSEAKCKVYYWMGDVKIWARIDPAVEAILWEAAYESAAKLVLLKSGYQVELLFSGTASDLQRANTDSRTVGIATAAHGGCSSDGDVWEFSRDGKEFSAYTTTPANNDWKPVQHPKEFVSVIAGHCYTGDNGKTGNIGLCKRAQASAMGISPGKVVTPLLVIHGGASLLTQYGAWLSFWMHFPFCCPLGRRRQ